MLRYSKYISLTIVSVIFLPVLILLLTTMPTFAIVPANETVINNVYAYQNCIETGDQLYIIYFTVEYDTNPDEPLGQAYIVSLLDESDTELGVGTLSSYYNDGYAEGVTSIYFYAEDAPTWEGDYTVKLVGNPTLSWTGSIPDVEFSGWSVWQDNSVNTNQLLISNRIRELAADLDLDWSEATYSLLDRTTVGTFLSTNGVEYFTEVIDNLVMVAPDVISYRNVTIDYDRTDFVYDYDQQYQQDLEDDISGSPFDITDASDLIGTSRGALTAFIYYGFAFTALVKLAPKVGSTKPLIAIMIPISLLGAFIGVPLFIVIVTCFVALVMLAFAIFYRPSTA